MISEVTPRSTRELQDSRNGVGLTPFLGFPNPKGCLEARISTEFLNPPAIDSSKGKANSVTSKTDGEDDEEGNEEEDDDEVPGPRRSGRPVRPTEKVK